MLNKVKLGNVDTEMLRLIMRFGISSEVTVTLKICFVTLANP